MWHISKPITKLFKIFKPRAKRAYAFTSAWYDKKHKRWILNTEDSKIRFVTRNHLDIRKTTKNLKKPLTKEKYVAQVRASHIEIFNQKTREVFATHDFKDIRGSKDSLQIVVSEHTNDGWFILCETKLKNNTHQYFGILFDSKNPGYVIWHDLLPLAQHQFDEEYTYLGGAVLKHMIHLLYVNEAQNRIEEVILRYPFAKTKENRTSPKLHKFEGNPIIGPIAGSGWESLATYNPTAFEMDGKIHILYRAQGDSWQSTLGWAVSEDGKNISYRHDRPVLWPRHPEEGRGYIPTPRTQPMKGLYGSDGSSGLSGGIGGVEDVRVTRMNGKIYALYAAYNGYEQTRLAMCAIDEDEFRKENFHTWSYPVMLSPKPKANGEGIKAGVLFPEQVGGKYVAMFRKFPDICIDQLEEFSLDHDHYLETKQTIGPSSEGWDFDQMGSGPPHHWDAYKIGAGGAPVKTKYGWLLIYQGFGLGNDFGRYRAGAMLLDLDDPTKVLARSRTPVIDSTEPYEEHGLKPHVIYPCGTVIKDNTLFVYYGAADTSTCVATANVDEFCQDLLAHTEGIDKTTHYDIM